ncbi:hypothetical protein AQPE_3402 [Aquipluma nitroreducens]|uniref:Uncharacterized protein n=1 Tax=Aquipluma nitroreducens TaxID=2010828 RepID=A0A5K7SCQ6_9BACT|nr:hypothetical protein AQPE_3402 [Aquipluma nitroreducens]
MWNLKIDLCGKIKSVTSQDGSHFYEHDIFPINMTTIFKYMAIRFLT